MFKGAFKRVPHELADSEKHGIADLAASRFAFQQLFHLELVPPGLVSQLPPPRIVEPDVRLPEAFKLVPSTIETSIAGSLGRHSKCIEVCHHRKMRGEMGVDAQLMVWMPVVAKNGESLALLSRVGPPKVEPALQLLPNSKPDDGHKVK